MVTHAMATPTATHHHATATTGISSRAHESKIQATQTDSFTTQKQAGTSHNKEQLKELTQQLNTQAEHEHLNIAFGYDEELKRVYISVIDKASGKEIRKLPSDEALKFAKSMKESLGRLLDKRG